MTSEAPRIIREVISHAEVRELAERGFGEMVKASVEEIADPLIRR